MNKTKKSIIDNLRWNESLIEIGADDIVEVSRNTTGNLLPAFTQEMTLKEAIEKNAWDTCSGTMEAMVRLSPSVYDDPIRVCVKNGFAYGIAQANE